MNDLTKPDLLDCNIIPLAPPRLYGDIHVSLYRLEYPGIDLIDIPGNLSDDLFYCGSPQNDTACLAIGSVIEFAAESYYDVNRIARKLVYHEPEELPCPLPDWFCYISFPFESSPGIPYAKFVMPEFMIKREGSQFTLRVNTREPHFNGPEDTISRVKGLLNRMRDIRFRGHKLAEVSIVDDPREFFYSGIDRIKDAVSAGRISKGVLSRDRKIEFTGDFSFPQALRELSSNYPECTIIFTNYPGRRFIAATPERLFRLEGKTVKTEALAGSIKTESDADDQLIMEEQLLLSGKDFEEHVIVRDYLTARLAPVAETISYSERPEVKKLSNVTHLRTPIDATLKDGVTAVDLGKLLFPTPALCGEPMETAAELINSIEHRKRDLYGGVTGFISNHGMSEFYVSIRCGFVDDNQATLYAGCGIVAGSDPQSEYEETNLKFIPLTSLFTDANQS